MINLLKKHILSVLYSDRYLDNFLYTYLKILLLNKISHEKLGVFKIKNFRDLAPIKKILNGYIYNSKTQNNNSVVVPDLRLYMLREAIIHAKSSAVVINSTIYYEPVNDNERFNGGFVQVHNSKNAVVNVGNPVVFSDGFFLAGNGSHNWYHWLIEILPKMFYYDSEYSRNILVNQSCKEIPSMAETLQALVESYDVNIIYLDPLKTYRIKKLYFINEVNKLMYNELDFGKATQPLYYYRKESLEKLSEVLKNKYVTDSKSSVEKIYLQRPNTHRIPGNEKEIAELLGSNRFSFIDLSKCSIHQQVEIFASAKQIVGTSGAAFTNLLFCRPNTRIVIFMPDNYSSYQFYKEMGELLQLDVVYLYYKNGSNTHEHSGFTVDKNKLHRLIEMYE